MRIRVARSSGARAVAGLITPLLPVALLYFGQAAAAPPACMSQEQAEKAWPDQHLHWRGHHCWYGRGRPREMREVTKPPPVAPAAPEPIIFAVEPLIKAPQNDPPLPDYIWVEHWPNAREFSPRPVDRAHKADAEAGRITPRDVVLAIAMIAATLAVIEVAFGDKLFPRKIKTEHDDAYWT